MAAIAEVDQRIAIGPDRFHMRKAGDVLHADRESLETLKKIQREAGSNVFAAQYQLSLFRQAAAFRTS